MRMQDAPPPTHLYPLSQDPVHLQPHLGGKEVPDSHRKQVETRQQTRKQTRQQNGTEHNSIQLMQMYANVTYGENISANVSRPGTFGL